MGLGLHIVEILRWHSAGLLCRSDRPDAETSLADNTQQETDIHAPGGIRTRNFGPASGHRRTP